MKTDMTEEITSYIKNALAKRNIAIIPDMKPVFENHIQMLADRLEKGTCTDIDSRELEEQIRPDSLKLSDEILKPLFAKYSTPISRSEIALLAVYLDMAEQKGE